MPTLAEARKLAREVWPGHSVICHEDFQHPRAWVAAAVSGDLDAIPPLEIFAPTRRAALVGLCAALEAMSEVRR